MLRINSLAAVLLLIFGVEMSAQDNRKVTFAFLADTHIALGAPAVDDLRKCINDINSLDSLDFVMFGGDVTDFGTDSEIELAKSMMDSLKFPYYVVAGNHDANWSESGCNTFVKVFGYEHFSFSKGGWRFLGCNSGPDMRMAPALAPRETMIWLDDIPSGEKSIFINHFPMDSSVLNYCDVLRTLKSKDVRFEIGGHWHNYYDMSYNGLPGVLCRSSLKDKRGAVGYSIVRIDGDEISISERRLFDSSSVELAPWYTRTLSAVADTVTYDANGLGSDYPWLRYDVNEKYPQVKELWKNREDANIVAGAALDDKSAYFVTTSGDVKAVSLKNGAQKWKSHFPGKIYSTPAVCGNLLVFGCTDGNIYALDSRNGKTKWAYETSKAVVGSPAIYEGKVYIGASDGVFRALNLSDGTLIWKYEGVEGHVVSTPTVDGDQVVFGSWGRKLYSLNPTTGALQWIWETPSSSRMISPASTVYLKTQGKIFVAIPSRRVYAIDAATGKELAGIPGGRDAIGMSKDGKKVYSKTMFNHVYAIDASLSADNPKIWEKESRTGYEIAPSALSVEGGMVLIPTDKGNIMAMSEEDGSYLWGHKISIALVNPMKTFVKDGKVHILATTMDGVVSLMRVD